MKDTAKQKKIAVDVEKFWLYVDKYAAKVIRDGTEGNSLFCYEMSVQVLQDALNGREV